MDTLSVSVRYRPLRIGWCIRSNNFVALRESWRLSSTMWGGRYNPIIPVDDLDYARALVELFRVDLLWPAADDATVKSFIESFPHLPNPLFHDQLFVAHGNGTKSAAILDICHPIRLFYDEHFKNNPNPEPKVMLYEWAQEDPLSDIWLATFGAVPSKDVTGTDYLELLEKYLAAERIAIGPADPWPVGSKDRWTLSGLGRSGIQRHYSVRNYWGHPGFYFGSAGDFEDLINYWNLRATDTHIIFFDPMHVDRFDGIRTEWLEVLRARPEGRFESDNSIAIWSKDRDGQRDLSAFGQGLRICTVDAGVWNGLNVKATQDTPLIRALGLAHHWQRLLDDGKVQTIADIAQMEGIDVTQVRRLLRLVLLAPTLVEMIVVSNEQASINLEFVLRRAMPANWQEQGALFAQRH